MSANEVVAANMRRLRKSRGWSQAELGAAMGWDAAQVSYAEGAGRRRRQFTVNDLEILARVFGTEPAALLRAPECRTCGGEPPAGFSCQDCGSDGAPPPPVPA